MTPEGPNKGMRNYRKHHPLEGCECAKPRKPVVWLQNPPRGTTVSKTWGGCRRVGRSDGCVPQLPAQPGAGTGHSKAWAAARAASAWRMRRSLEGTWCQRRAGGAKRASGRGWQDPPAHPPLSPPPWPVLGDLTTSHVRTRQGCVTVRLTFTVRINAPQEAGENRGKGSERNSVP